MSLLIIVPTRGRRKQAERLLDSYEKNTSFAEMMFVLDPDDEDTYEGMDWKSATHGTLSPRESLSGKLNQTAMAFKDDFDALMFVADDHVFRTEGWDTVMMGKLKEIGGSGILYPDDKRRTDIPEIVLISSDIVKALGQFAEPMMKHYYLDNAWADLGKRAGLLRFVPEVIIEHLHYQVDPSAVRDETYSYAEETWGVSDQKAFFEWRANVLPLQAALLQRKFNPDRAWILSKI